MKIFSVSELNASIKSLLEPSFRSLSLKGEISNFKLQSSGHLYFSLKDESSQISAVLFKMNAALLSRMPKEGDQVVARGELSLYMPRGSYQVIIRELQFLGQGELLLKLQTLKETLQKRGWFDQNLKKSIPKVPKTIGIVTSPTGAVIQDMLNILNRRFSSFHVVINPVKVQGVGAAEEIAQAIDDFNRYALADVLIIGRGGGSIEDLWAFNEEIVAKAIFASKIPVISAVGHETDFTIADFVADLRAPTPSAAAEMVILEKAAMLKFLRDKKEALQGRLAAQTRQGRLRLEALQKHPLFSSPFALLSERLQKVDQIRSALDDSSIYQLQKEKMRLRSAEQNMRALQPLNQITAMQEKAQKYLQSARQSIAHAIRHKKEALQALTSHLQSVNPKNVLQKGYSILQTENGHVILSAKETQAGQKFTALLHDGRIEAIIR